MCTVTFIPKNHSDFILTSNRDEAPGRETVFPGIYEEEGVRLLFPKDKVAGGTWIGISSQQRCVCLMNGGFVAHKRKAFYGRSRGLIVKDLLLCPDVDEYLEKYDFSEIEPFTVILVDWKNQSQLTEIVWDGERLHQTNKPWKSFIWSSSPLYSPELKNLRENWFKEFNPTADKSPKDVLDFHKNGGEGDLNSNLIIDRGFVKTKSITQITKNEDLLKMYYDDLETKKQLTVKF